jgi:hypothetical protein
VTVQAIRPAGESYTGPAGVVFTPDELLVIWADLTRIPTTENKSVREKIAAHLESKKNNGVS